MALVERLLFYSVDSGFHSPDCLKAVSTQCLVAVEFIIQHFVYLSRDKRGIPHNRSRSEVMPESNKRFARLCFIIRKLK